MIRGLVFCGLCAIAAALLALSSPGQQLERQVGLRLLYAARGNLAAPEGALIVGLDRASIGWLQRNIDCPRRRLAVSTGVFHRWRETASAGRATSTRCRVPSMPAWFVFWPSARRA